MELVSIFREHTSDTHTLLVSDLSQNHLSCDSLSQVFNGGFGITAVIPFGRKVIRPGIHLGFPFGEPYFHHHFAHLAERLPGGVH